MRKKLKKLNGLSYPTRIRKVTDGRKQARLEDMG